MNLINKGIKYITNSRYRFLINDSLGLYNKLPDEKYLSKKYESKMGKALNLAEPKTFNEKLQWLKLHDRHPEYTRMVDKYLVREYIGDKLGEEYLIPLLGAWDSPDEIDFSALPNEFVLKCNHNSGLGMCICKDKSKLDVDKTKNELRKGLRQDYYLTGREWPYKNVKRKIIAEKFMTDSNCEELKDYKIHNFNGIPKFILVCRDRYKDTGLTEDFYSPEWEKLEIKRPGCPNAEYALEKPEMLEKMLEFSKILSKDIPFLRTDFYIINQKIYFGELTFYPASGFTAFEPDKWDDIFGDWINAPTN